MGKWLTALKNHGMSESGTRQNPQNLPDGGSVGFVGSPSVAPASFSDPDSAGAGRGLSVLSGPGLRDCEIFSPGPDGHRDASEAHGAIIGFDSGIPSTWAMGVASLTDHPAPLGMDSQAWGRLVDAATAVLGVWGAQLAGLGWSAVEVFGLDPRAPLHRFDTAGLVLLLPTRAIVAVTPDLARLRSRSGALQTFHLKSVAAGGVPLWTLADATSRTPLCTDAAPATGGDAA